MNIVANLGLYDSSDMDAIEEIDFTVEASTFLEKFSMKSKISRDEFFNTVKELIGTDVLKFINGRSFFTIKGTKMFIRVGIDNIGSFTVPSVGYGYLITDEEEDTNRFKFSVTIIGTDRDEVLRAKKILYDHLAKNRTSSIVWSFTSSTGEIQKKEIFIGEQPAIVKEFYPWIKEDTIQDFYHNYLRSPESILLLTGIPGTGKTTFIRNMIVENNLNADITYDEKLITSDAFFLDFINDKDKDILVIEDADTLLYDREREKSTVLNKILNISDGLIKNVAKKIIFSTNITDIDMIDPALIRPGRCYDVLDFRKLSYEESLKVVDAKGLDRTIDQREHTLAELFSSNKREQTTNKRKMGF